jgi:hypothetical protein
MKTRNTFYCPECFGNICVSDKIILKIKSDRNDVGMVILSSKISDYTSEVSDAIRMVEGANYKFYCPLCAKCLNLESTNNRLIKLLMRDKENKKYEIFFSGIFGEKCTYIMKDYKLEYFGKHCKKYLDQMEKYKEYYEKYL